MVSIIPEGRDDFGIFMKTLPKANYVLKFDDFIKVIYIFVSKSLYESLLIEVQFFNYAIIRIYFIYLSEYKQE